MSIFIIYTPTVLAQGNAHLPVNSQGTYLRTNNDPQAIGVVPVNLETHGLAPGAKIRIQRVGAYSYCKGCPTCVPPRPVCPDNAVEMIGVFSTSSVLLPASNLSRIPGAIAIGVSPVTTTPTDISQDFWISNNSVSEITVEIPAGAKFLFVAAKDFHYGDNYDPNGDFAVRIYYPQPLIRITLMAPLPLNGTTYVIEPEPKMPIISARADVIGLPPQQNSKIKFTWTVKLRTKDGRGKEEIFDDVFKQNETTNGGKTYTVRLNKDDTFRGGNITLTAKATVNGQEIEGQTPAALTIQGRNPSRGDVQSYVDSVARKKFGNAYKGLSLSDIQDAMKRIACHESPGQRQFKAPVGEVGHPIVAGDNGVGIFQITSTTKCRHNPFTSCPNAIFNWKLNVELAAENIKEKVAVASMYPNDLAKDSASEFGQYVHDVINPARVTAKLEPIPLKQNGGKFFINIKLPAYTTTGSFNNLGVNQLLEDMVRGNNGFATTLFGLSLHEYKPSEEALKTLPLNSLKTDSRVWKVVPSDERPSGIGQPNYVNIVRGTSALCPAP